MYSKQNEKEGGIFNRVKKKALPSTVASLLTGQVSPASPAKTALILPNYFYKKATKCMALFVRLLPQRAWSNHNR